MRLQKAFFRLVIGFYLFYVNIMTPTGSGGTPPSGRAFSESLKKANKKSSGIISIISGLCLFVGLIWITVTIDSGKLIYLTWAVVCLFLGFALFFYLIWRRREIRWGANEPDEKSEHL